MDDRSSRGRAALPADVQRLLVASLFGDSTSLLVGALTTLVAITVTAVRTGSMALGVCAAVFLGVATGRLLLIRRYRRREPPVTLAAPGMIGWELAYSIGAALHCLVLGVWCCLCLTVADDPFAELLSAVVTVGCASAVPGRNFGRIGIATTQIVCLCLPLCLGWVLHGDWWYGALTVLALPFFASLRIMTVRLQGTLIDALTSQNRIGVLAERFDAALRNMPLGLCMIDSDQRVRVFNARFADLLDIGPEQSLLDAALPPLLPQAVSPLALGGPDQQPARRLEALTRSCASGGFAIELKDGRTVELTLQPIADGGAVVLAEDITRRREADLRILKLARFDTVTEIANRAFFVEQMEQRLAGLRVGKSPCAFLFVDLDRFKMVNDTLGHGYGDMLLRDVASRLRAAARPSDLVGRFGGDEFVVFQSPLRDRDEVDDLAERIVRQMAEPFEIGGETVRIAASVGVVFSGDASADTDLMIQRADLALYRAKAAGRGRWTQFEESMDLAVLQRRMLEMELRAALDSWDFEIYFQPLFGLEEMRIRTCEALLRWRHAKLGMISPATFIPIAEELGLIGEIGLRVLQSACAECAGWPADLSVAVNLSPAQFDQGDVVAAIRDALQASGLAPHRLEVEITESVLLQNTDATRELLQRIQSLGVRVVLDDFGTGHSSLSYLHSFPLQKVKLDRSFLADVLESARSNLLLEGICDLSHKLGLTVVVEGIETQAQFDIIKRLDTVDEAQGFLLGRPMPRLAMVALLEDAEAASNAGRVADHGRSAAAALAFKPAA